MKGKILIGATVGVLLSLAKFKSLMIHASTNRWILHEIIVGEPIVGLLVSIVDLALKNQVYPEHHPQDEEKC